VSAEGKGKKRKSFRLAREQGGLLGGGSGAFGGVLGFSRQDGKKGNDGRGEGANNVIKRRGNRRRVGWRQGVCGGGI